MLSVSTARVQLPVAVPRQGSRAVAAPRRPAVLARAEPAVADKSETQQKNEIETAVDNAKARCEEGTASECAQAWDAVEELSAEASHAKAKKGAQDPLEKYCEGEPDADECRVYED